MLAAAAAGCGGGGERSAPPRLPAQVASDLAARSDAVAQRLDSGDGCGARAEAEALQVDAIAAVNEGRIPARYQEELAASVATLVASVECVPAPTAKQGKRKHDDEDEKEDEEEDD